MNPLITLIITKLVEFLFSEENIKVVKDAILELIEGDPSQTVKDALDDLEKAPSEDMIDFVGNVLEAETNVTKEQFATVLINKAHV